MKSHLKTLGAGLLLSLAALGAQAATLYSFSGITDPVGTQTNQAISGNFSFETVAAGYSGAVSLSSFSMSFLGHAYELADADTEALAWFDAGNFLGIDFIDFDDDSRPSVGLTAGFFDVSEAFFSYGSPAGIEGFGSVAFAEQRVPLPGSLALAGLAGLLAARGSRRRVSAAA